MPDEHATIREQDLFRNEMTARFDKLDERMGKQDEMLRGISIQTTKTNGRVNGLEKREEDNKDIVPNLQDQVNKQQNWKWYVMGIGAAVLILGGVIYGLTIQNVNSTIDKKISESQKIIIQAIYDQLKGSAPNFTNSVSVH